MFYGEPTTLPAVLDAIRQKVQAAVRLPADRVFFSLADDGWHLRFPPDDRFVVVRPVSGQADQRGVAGGGRAVTAFDGSLRAACFARLDRDLEGRATRAVGVQSGSLLQLMEAVLDALQMFEPVNSSVPPACLLREPMRTSGWSVSPRSDKDANPWAVAETTWRFDYRLKLS